MVSSLTGASEAASHGSEVAQLRGHRGAVKQRMQRKKVGIRRPNWEIGQQHWGLRLDLDDENSAGF